MSNIVTELPELPEGWEWEDKFRIVKCVNHRTGRTDIEVRFGKLGVAVKSEYPVVLIPQSVILVVLSANNALPNSTVKEIVR